MDILQRNLEYLINRNQTNTNQLAHDTGIPQPTIYRILSGETRNPRSSTLLILAKHFRVSLEALQQTDLRANEVSSKPINIAQPYKQVPVVGHVKGGADGFLEEMEYPMGHGDGHVEYPARDRNAYALRVKGDSMRPRIRNGEFVIVEPGHKPHPGDDVVVSTHDGRRLLKELLYERNGDVALGSINADYGTVTLARSEIRDMHYVAAIVPSGAFYKPF